MLKIILLIVFVLFSETGFSSGTKEAFCERFSSMTEKQITDKFGEELFINNYENFFFLLDKIQMGEKNCFRAGAILGSDPHRFGSANKDIIQSFSKFADKKPEEFSESCKQLPISGDFFESIMRIPDWEINNSQFRKIRKKINLRKRNFDFITVHKDRVENILREYDNVLLKLDKLSHTEYEYFHNSGSRLIYSSNKPDLVSDKRYPLSNLVDNNNETAWCISETSNETNAPPYIKISFYMTELKSDDFKCEYKNKMNYCFIDTLILRVRPGYQKNVSTFTNNSRPKSITGVIRVKNHKNKFFIDQKTYKNSNDSLEEVVMSLPIRQFIRMRSRPMYLKINFESIKKGNKYRDMCISDLAVDILP